MQLEVILEGLTDVGSGYEFHEEIAQADELPIVLVVVEGEDWYTVLKLVEERHRGIVYDDDLGDVPSAHHSQVLDETAPIEYATLTTEEELD
jgi:hypothetical protein